MPRRLAILIGNQSFLPESNLLPLQGPPNDVAAMERLLGDPQRGNFAVRTLLDRPHHEITSLIEEELGNRGENELVLIYYSGHGKPDIKGRLCLATADTREKTLLTSSIRAQNLVDIVEASFHNQVVIILDCCYSARIGDRGDPSAELQDKARETSGLFILTSSDKQQISREETAAQDGQVMGLFTSALLRSVESEDVVNADGEIRLRALLPRLEKDQHLAGQKPKFFAQDARGDPLISRDPRFVENALDPRWIADLKDNEWHRRAGAVAALGSVLHKGSPAQRHAARKALAERLDLARPDHERDYEVRREIERRLDGGHPGPAEPPAAGEAAPPQAIGEARPASSYGIWTKTFIEDLRRGGSPVSSAIGKARPDSPAEPVRPDWASDTGRDQYGPWASFTLQDQAGQPLTQRLRWIPPGRFRMGSPPDEPGRWDNEGPQHDVTLAAGFWLFDTQVTQALWQVVMGINPSRFIDAHRPVENVSFEDVKAFLFLVSIRPWGRGLVLPSESQWDYACRAGTEAATYAGPMKSLGEHNAPVLDEIAWYGGNSGVDFDLENGFDSSGWPQKQYPHTRAGTRKVAQKRPNPWGLYDMLGNVKEWCADSWHDSYMGAPADGSAWIDLRASEHVVRGGSWPSAVHAMRAAYRYGLPRHFHPWDIGFRCARP